MNKQLYSKAFSNNMNTFMDYVRTTFPENVQIQTAINALSTAKSTNIKLLIQMWCTQVYVPYKDQIDARDIRFFLTKDYSKDVSSFQTGSSKEQTIMNTIDNLRETFKKLDPSIQNTLMEMICSISLASYSYMS